MRWRWLPECWPGSGGATAGAGAWPRERGATAEAAVPLVVWMPGRAGRGCCRGDGPLEGLRRPGTTAPTAEAAAGEAAVWVAVPEPERWWWRARGAGRGGWPQECWPPVVLAAGVLAAGEDAGGVLDAGVLEGWVLVLCWRILGSSPRDPARAQPRSNDDTEKKRRGDRRTPRRRACPGHRGAQARNRDGRVCAAGRRAAKITVRIQASMKVRARPPQAYRHTRRVQAPDFR